MVSVGDIISTAFVSDSRAIAAGYRRYQPTAISLQPKKVESWQPKVEGGDSSRCCGNEESPGTATAAISLQSSAFSKNLIAESRKLNAAIALVMGNAHRAYGDIGVGKVPQRQNRLAPLSAYSHQPSAKKS